MEDLNQRFYQYCIRDMGWAAKYFASIKLEGFMVSDDPVRQVTRWHHCKEKIIE
jgi:hypothetical protein